MRASVLDALPRYEFGETGVGCATHDDPNCLCDVVITTPVHARYAPDEIMFGRTVARRMNLAAPMSVNILQEWAERTLGLYDEAKGWAQTLGVGDHDELDTWVLDMQYAKEVAHTRGRREPKRNDAWAERFGKVELSAAERRQQWDEERQALLRMPSATKEQHERWVALLAEMPPTAAAREVGLPVPLLMRGLSPGHALRRYTPTEMDGLWADLREGVMASSALADKWRLDQSAVRRLQTVFGAPRGLTANEQRQWTSMCFEHGIEEACRRIGQPFHTIIANGSRGRTPLTMDEFQFVIDAINENLTYKQIADVCPLTENGYAKMKTRYRKERAA